MKFVYLLSLVFTTSSCIKFGLSDKEVISYFANAKYRPQNASVVLNGEKVSYNIIGDSALPIVFFVHGSPGDWTAYYKFFTDSLILQKACIISLDRPGFGKSTLRPEPYLKKQAACLIPILDKYKNKKVIMVGHSYGGPVIARFAMDYPARVDGLIFLAPALDPSLEKREWFRGPMRSWLGRNILPNMMLSSNEEILGLKQGLTDMLSLWGNIKIPVIHIHGDKDDLVPVQNAAFVKSKLTNTNPEIIILKDEDHFLPWKQSDLIRACILKQIQQIENSQTTPK